MALFGLPASPTVLLPRRSLGCLGLAGSLAQALAALIARQPLMGEAPRPSGPRQATDSPTPASQCGCDGVVPGQWSNLPVDAAASCTLATLSVHL